MSARRHGSDAVSAFLSQEVAQVWAADRLTGESRFLARRRRPHEVKGPRANGAARRPVVSTTPSRPADEDDDEDDDDDEDAEDEEGLSRAGASAEHGDRRCSDLA